MKSLIFSFLLFLPSVPANLPSELPANKPESITDGNPVAAFVVSVNPAKCNQTIVFDASQSYHTSPLHSIIRFEWDFNWISGRPQDFRIDAFGNQISHQFSMFGFYKAGLKVTDDQGLVAYATVNVNVTLGNLSPVTNAGGPYYVQIGSDIHLTGSASIEPNESCGDAIAAYSWDLNVDGTTDATGVTVTVTGSQYATLFGEENLLGSHIINLKTEDTFGASSEDTAQVIVYENIPHADFSWLPETVLKNQEVDFDGSSSAHGSPFHKIVTYQWDFGDGATGTGKSIKHTFAEAGEFKVKLIVTDDNSPSLNSLNEKIVKAGIPTGILKSEAKNFARIYPNPASDILVVETSEPGSVNLVLTDLTGKTLMETLIFPGRNILPVSNLRAGSYVIIISDGVRIESSNLIISK
jgi:PKD repeat protein